MKVCNCISKTFFAHTTTNDLLVRKVAKVQTKIAFAHLYMGLAYVYVKAAPLEDYFTCSFSPLLKRFPILKGQCHEIFYHWFFSSNCSSWAQETYPETISIFFDYSQRYSIISVLHRCQRHR